MHSIFSQHVHYKECCVTNEMKCHTAFDLGIDTQYDWAEQMYDGNKKSKEMKCHGEFDLGIHTHHDWTEQM